MPKEPNVFDPNWPEGLKADTHYRAPCDDKGRNGGSWIQVMVSGQDGDVYVSMQDWEEMPEGAPSPFPSLRNRTYAGGGRYQRTHQALLWLADAIRRDNEEIGNFSS